MEKLTPKDCASLALSTGQLLDEVSQTDAYKKITSKDRFPNYEVAIEVSVVVRNTASGPHKNAMCFSVFAEQPNEVVVSVEAN